jgi:hypothetical protein
MKPHCRLGGGTSYFGGTHCLHVHNQKAIIWTFTTREISNLYANQWVIKNVKTSLLGLTFLPVARFSWWLLSNRSHSLLKAAHPEQFPQRVPVGPGLSPPSCFSVWWGENYLECLVLLHLHFLHSAQSLLSFLRGRTPP